MATPHQDNPGSSNYNFDASQNGSHYKAMAAAVATIIRRDGPTDITVFQHHYDAVAIRTYGPRDLQIEVVDIDFDRLSGGEWSYIAAAAQNAWREWLAAERAQPQRATVSLARRTDPSLPPYDEQEDCNLARYRDTHRYEDRRDADGYYEGAD